jgi:hypothetical protein
MRLVRIEQVLGRVSIVAGWKLEDDLEYEVIDLKSGALLRECPLGAGATFLLSASSPPAAVDGVVYSAEIHAGRFPHLREGGVEGRQIGCLLAADKVATPAPFSVLRWAPLLGHPRWRRPCVPDRDEKAQDGGVPSARPGQRPLVRAGEGWAERAVYSLRPWDAVALWQTPESAMFGGELGRLGDLMGEVVEHDEKLLGVVLNERGRVRFVEEAYWSKWKRNLPNWARAEAGASA